MKIPRIDISPSDALPLPTLMCGVHPVYRLHIQGPTTMLTVHCPTCKRVLHAPEERGAHRVACPGCGAAFAVVCEGGIGRTVSTSVSARVPFEKPTMPMEVDESPNLVSATGSTVFESEKQRRTRHIHLAFEIGFCGSLAILVYLVLFEEEGRFEWVEFCSQLPLIFFVSAVLGGYFAFFVAMVLMVKSGPRARGAKILRQMRKASHADAHTPADDGAAAPTDSGGHFLDPTGVPPKDSQT